MLFSSYTYRLFSNTYVLICTYLPIYKIPTFLLIKYLHPTYPPSYLLPTYIITRDLHINYLATN
jgi:hypothetical protein